MLQDFIIEFLTLFLLLFFVNEDTIWKLFVVTKGGHDSK